MGLCRTNVMLDRELWKAAQEAGKSDDRSGSWILNRALEQYLNQKKPRQKASSKKFNDDDLKLAEWMESRVKMISPAAKKANLESWANTIRLMREVDGRTLQEIGSAFDWANKDSFWCSNILSPEKLRKQYDKLNAKRLNNEGTKPASQQPKKLSAAERQQLRIQQKYGQQSGGLGMGQDERDLRGAVDSGEWRGAIIDVDSSTK